jgi:nitrogen fixation NifU-like protein
MAYSVKVLDHYENPRNVGSFGKDDEGVATGMVGAPACGDVMKLQIKVGKGGVIEDAKFKTYGCGSAIASSSLVTEWVKGKTIEQALDIKNTQIAEELALPPVKIHCSILAEDAIKAAVADYKKKHADQACRLSSQPDWAEASTSPRSQMQITAGGFAMAVTLSERAANHVANYMVKRGKGIGLRLGVRTSGCSGMAYKLEFADVRTRMISSSNRMASGCWSIRRACPTSTAPSSTMRARASTKASSSTTRTSRTPAAAARVSTFDPGRRHRRRHDDGLLS